VCSASMRPVYCTNIVEPMSQVGARLADLGDCLRGLSPEQVGGCTKGSSRGTHAVTFARESSDSDTQMQHPQMVAILERIRPPSSLTLTPTERRSLMPKNHTIQEEVASSCREATGRANDIEPQIQELFVLADQPQTSEERFALLAKAHLLEWQVLSLQEGLFAHRSEMPAEPSACVALLEPLDNAQAGLAFLQEDLVELRATLLARELPPRREWDRYWGGDEVAEARG